MKKLKLTLIAAGIIMSSYAAKSQDFFNGMPGPKKYQSDQYINFGEKNVNGNYVLKAFPNLGENKKMLLALPFGVDKTGVKMNGVNLGYMQQNIFGENLYSTVALGAFRGSDANLTQVTPQIYVTYLNSGASIDLEGKLNFNTETGKQNQTASLTLGFGSDYFRAGVSTTLSDGKKPEYQFVARYDITKDHKYWTEVYGRDNKTLGLRFAVNF